MTFLSFLPSSILSLCFVPSLILLYLLYHFSLPLSLYCVNYLSLVWFYIIFFTLSYTGTVVTNASASDAPTVVLQFNDYASLPIIYPSLEKVLEVASKEMERVHIQYMHTHSLWYLNTQLLHSMHYAYCITGVHT